MYVGIKDNKIFDICSNLINKRMADDGIYLTKEELETVKYIESNLGDIYVGDTWDFEKNIFLKDSPMRFIEPEKLELELLQEKYDVLEARIVELEEKATTPTEI